MGGLRAALLGILSEKEKSEKEKSEKERSNS